MSAKVLNDHNTVLTEIDDFTVVVQVSATDEVVKDECYLDTSFAELASRIAAKYKSGITMSVLDYGDEMQAVITPNNARSKHCYTVYRHA